MDAKYAEGTDDERQVETHGARDKRRCWEVHSKSMGDIASNSSGNARGCVWKPIAERRKIHGNAREAQNAGLGTSRLKST